MNNTLSVISLFEKFKEIKIPIIQRDYAQGRESAKEIRKSFLENIKIAINDNKELHFDFIYGSVEAAGNVLILLDGQQRITTLFLLHWYAAVKDKKNKNFREFFCYQNSDDFKSKLRYEVRPSSEEFLDYLVSEDSIEFEENQNPSEVITDKNWFYLGWLHDPTVSGMLNMLDNINSNFSNMRGLFDKLANNHKIAFDFLELNNFGLTDDLYIKMNSRGKLLTPYENFKAKLEKLINEQRSNEFMKIAKKFDNEYIDYFWKIANTKEKNEKKDVAKLADTYMYNFFYNLTLNLYVLIKNENDLSNYSKLDDFIKENSLISFFNIVYNEKNNLNNLIDFLDEIIQQNDSRIYIDPIIKDTPALWDRVRFYAYYLWKLHHKDDPDWYRVLKNLINNELIQSLDDYIKAIKAIQEFHDKVGSQTVLEYIKDKENFIGFFRQNQQKEEKLKAERILSDNNWKEEIKSAEENWYLDGKIGFLIEFSKQDNDTYNLESFEQYRDKFIKLWDFAKKGLNNQILLYRALLTKGDYLPEIGSNKTFCSFEPSFRAKSESWHRVFESESKEYLRELLDDIDLNKGIKEQLEHIIKTHGISDWRKYFIENPDYIKYCEKLNLRFDEQNKKVYLLRSKQMNGRHAELHSWHFFNKCFELKPEDEREIWRKLEGEKPCEPFKKVEYVESTSYEEPYILLSGWKCKINNEEYNLELEILYEDKELFKFNIYEKHDKDLPVIEPIQFGEYSIKKEGTFTMPNDFDNCCKIFIKKMR